MLFNRFCDQLNISDNVSVVWKSSSRNFGSARSILKCERRIEDGRFVDRVNNLTATSVIARKSLTRPTVGRNLSTGTRTSGQKRYSDA